MDLSGIISISGKPGLFKVVAQSKNNIIVESLIDKKRVPAYSTDRISALEDISIYTYEEDIPLKEVFIKFAKKENCGPAPSHKESAKKLSSYLEEVLPEYDEDRVYSSDIKKLYQWYNILQKEGLITLEEKKKKEPKAKTKEDKSAPSKQDKKTTAPKKAPAAKKTTKKPTKAATEKKTTTEKKAASPKAKASTKAAPAKKATTKKPTKK